MDRTRRSEPRPWRALLKRATVTLGWGMFHPDVELYRTRVCVLLGPLVVEVGLLVGLLFDEEAAAPPVACWARRVISSGGKWGNARAIAVIPSRRVVEEEACGFFLTMVASNFACRALE